MSKSNNKPDYSGILLIILVGVDIVISLPFNIYINLLIAIGAVVLLIALFVAVSFGMVFFFARSIGARGQAIQDSWDYWEKMKSSKYEDLSDEEKNKLLIACRVISGDCGAVVSDDEIIEALETQLPILTPNVGLSYCK